MHFVLQTPSLQHVAEVSIVAHLWTQRDVFTQIARLHNRGNHYTPNEYSRQWTAIEDKLQSKVLALPLPELYKKRLLNFIKPLGMEMKAWCHYHSRQNNYQFFNYLLPETFCWTMHGIIDYAKTAELMVKDERLDVQSRYELACLNCLEDEAKDIPAERRWQCYSASEYNNYYNWQHLKLLTYFTCTLNQDTDRLNRLFRARGWRDGSINQYLFKEGISEGNRATCEYFCKKLSQPEKEQILGECQSFIYGRPSHHLLCYLSLMNEEQQKRTFREHTSAVLACLLHWPMQSLFMEAAECGWDYMNEYDTVLVLAKIILQICNGFRDYDYSQLFWGCWRLSPPDYKLQFLNDITRLYTLVATKEEQFINLVFTEAPSQRLNQLVEKRHDEISCVLMDERVICDAALMECKQRAALNSSNAPDDEEKRLKSQHLSRLVVFVLKSRRMDRRRLLQYRF